MDVDPQLKELRPAPIQRPVAIATPRVNRVRPPSAPVAMVTSAAATNQNPVAQTQGAMTQEQASVSSSQQFIPPGIYTSLQIDDVVSTYH